MQEGFPEKVIWVEFEGPSGGNWHLGRSEGQGEHTACRQQANDRSIVRAHWPVNDTQQESCEWNTRLVLVLWVN